MRRTHSEPARPHHHRQLDHQRRRDLDPARAPRLEQDHGPDEAGADPGPPERPGTPLAGHEPAEPGRPQRARRQQQRREPGVEPRLRPEHHPVAEGDEEHPDPERGPPARQRTGERHAAPLRHRERHRAGEHVPHPGVEERVEALQAHLDGEVGAPPDHADRDVRGDQPPPGRPGHRRAGYQAGSGPLAGAARSWYRPRPGGPT